MALDRDAWLVVIDPQTIFAAPTSDWGSPFFADAFLRIRELAAAFGPARTLVTRWLPTADRSTAWGDYFEAWSFADVSADDDLYALIPEARTLSDHATIDLPTFGKWGDELLARTGPAPRLVLTGVSTDCCVLSTALGAADGGARTRVVSDACAGSTAENHAAALHVMSLYPPQLTVVTAAEVLRSL